MQVPNAWPLSVASAIGIKELSFKNNGAGVDLHLHCQACNENYDVLFAKRYPPEVVKKKLQEKGWELRRGKTRCPNCVKTGKQASRVHDDHQPIVNTAELQAKMGYNDIALSLMIPEKSDLFQKFANESRKALYHWAFEVVQDKDRNLALSVTREELKPVKIRGKSAGSFIPAGKQFTLSIRASMIKGIELIEPFDVGASELIYERGDLLVFSFPKGYKRRALPQPAVEQAPPEPAPEPTPEPVIAQEPVGEERIEGAMLAQSPGIEPTEDRMFISKNMISLYHAIEVLNTHKRLMGDKLAFSVSESGFVSALAHYGIE